MSSRASLKPAAVEVPLLAGGGGREEGGQGGGRRRVVSLRGDFHAPAVSSATLPAAGGAFSPSLLIRRPCDFSSNVAWLIKSVALGGVVRPTA